MALSPIIGSRLSPPVDSIGDKQLERQRREFMDLLKSDERRHESDSRREHRERQHATDEMNRRGPERGGDRASRPTPATQPTGRNAQALRPDARQQNPQQPNPQQPSQQGASQQGSTQQAILPRPGTLAGGAISSRSSASSATTTSAPIPASTTGTVSSSWANADTARMPAEPRIAPVMRREREPGERSRDQSGPLAVRQPASTIRPESPQAGSGQAGWGQAGSGQVPAPVASPARPASTMPAVPRPQWPTPPAGSSLVASAPEAAGLNLVPPPTANAAFRLSSETPPEVARRIQQFMLTGLLDRKPFGFSQVAPVVDAGKRVETPEEKADRAVASLISEASPHMRRSLDLTSGATSAIPLPPEQIAARVAAIAALSRQPAAPQQQPQSQQQQAIPVRPRPAGGGSLSLVASEGGLVPAERGAEPSAARGASNPLFRIFAGDPEPLDRDEEDYLIKLMAGRSDARRDRIA